jgi:AcrR family transcriptional regulator
VTTRVRNPHGEGSRLRDELIAAAGRVLAAAPDADLSLRAVAREAGVAAPSVYLQFADKTELVGAVIAHYFEQLREVVVNAIATAAEPVDRLRAGCLAYCRFGLERPGPYHVLFASEAPVAHVLGRFGDPDDAGTRAFATLIDAIRDCMTAGIARPGDPFRQATLFWSAMHGYVSLVQLQRGFPWQPVDEFVDDLITTFINAPADPDRQ